MIRLKSLLSEVVKDIIGKEHDIEKDIKFLRNVPQELKDVALELLKPYTKAQKGRITGLQLHPLLKKKISEKGLPNGFDMGIDKNGYFISTHRARSKSFPTPDKIDVKSIKFIDSTG
mgnify:CR=1